jgi:enoyl-CoA hydratase
MADGHILREVADGVMTLTLNRPEKLNALTPAMAADLLDSLHAAERDPSVSAILIKGAGRSFCAGLDLGALVAADAGAGARTPHDDLQVNRRWAASWRQVFELRRPVVVAVHGHCLGIPLDLVLHTDLAIAADDAVFGYPAVRGTGLPGAHMYVYRIGAQWAKRLLLTGDTIDAATAERIGLVLKVVPRAELEAEALALARALRQVPLPLLEAGKNVINHAIELMGYTALQRVNWDEMAMARATPELQEFSRIAEEQGMKAAVAWRDRKLQAQG